MLRNCVATATFLLLGAIHPSAGQTANCSVTDALLDKGTISTTQALKDGILCLANQISQTNDQPGVKPKPVDEQAAKKIIILASKIIGNGSPVAAATATSPLVAGTAVTQPKAIATQVSVTLNRDLAKQIICRANALMGQGPSVGQSVTIDGVKCGPETWSKPDVIELAYKIIGNG